MEAPWLRNGWIGHTQRLLDSFRFWLGRDLIPRTRDSVQDAEALFLAPLVVVSHGREADPILNYGNRAALTLWEIEIPALLQMPSRLTAEPLHRDERARLLERTSRDGFVDDYRGIRVSRTGRRFQIDQAIVWNVLDSEGALIGQAAAFSEWQEIV